MSISQNSPQKPTNTPPRESADEKMVKALLHQAMKKVLKKRDITLLAVAQQMVETGDVQEKQPKTSTPTVPEKNLSDDDLLTILDRKISQ